MKNRFGRTALAMGLSSVFAFAGSNAMAQQVFPDFTASESAVSGANPVTITADKITGSYIDVITFTSGANGAASGTFSLSRQWSAAQYAANDGTTLITSQLGGVSSNQYGLYLLYRATGTYVNNSDGTTSLTLLPGGTVSMFLDPASNTSLGAPLTGVDGWTSSNAGDDVPIATGTLTAGQARLEQNSVLCTNGISCGSFGWTSSFVLTSAGSQYFVAPSPYYNLLFQSGQMNNFSPTGTQVTGGSMDVTFGSTITPPPPPPPPPALITFANFSPRLIVANTRNGSTFNFNSAITLGANGSPFDPFNNSVVLQLAGSTLIIPAGSFQPNTTGGFAYSGTINGIAVNATIQAQAGGTYRVTISGTRAPLAGLTNPVSVRLQVGQNTGTAAITATLTGAPAR